MAHFLKNMVFPVSKIFFTKWHFSHRRLETSRAGDLFGKPQASVGVESFDKFRHLKLLPLGME